MRGFHCSRCGQLHDDLPLSFGVPAPAYYYSVPEGERQSRCLLSSDQCIIDEEHFFIVANLDLPIIGGDEAFSWSIWVSLSQASFERASQLWESSGRESEPPYFGWVSTALLGYAKSTLSLPSSVHTKPVGIRPIVELHSGDHPVILEQERGIEPQRAVELATIALHGPVGS